MPGMAIEPNDAGSAPVVPFLIEPGEFLAGSGLLRQWALDGFRRGLRWAAEAEGFGMESVRQRGGIVRFSLIPPPGDHPSPQFKTHARLHRLFKRIGLRVPDRQLWLRVGRRRRAVAVIAAPTIP